MRETHFSRQRGQVGKIKVLWPSVFIGILGSFAETFVSENFSGFAGASLNLIISILIAIFALGYQSYILNLARTGYATFGDIMECIKNKWIRFMGLIFLIILIDMFTNFLLAISPNILKAAILILIVYLVVSYSMIIYLLVDTDLKLEEALKTSKDLINGHKVEYLKVMFSLSKPLIITEIIVGVISFWFLKTTAQASVAIYGGGLGVLMGLLGATGILAIIAIVVLFFVTIYVTPTILLGSAEYYDKLLEKSKQPPKVVIKVTNDSADAEVEDNYFVNYEAEAEDEEEGSGFFS